MALLVAKLEQLLLRKWRYWWKSLVLGCLVVLLEWLYWLVVAQQAEELWDDEVIVLVIHSVSLELDGSLQQQVPAHNNTNTVALSLVVVIAISCRDFQTKQTSYLIQQTRAVAYDIHISMYYFLVFSSILSVPTGPQWWVHV